ncbi:ribonuclease H-like domain-containing protein [Tanacetum coccineum]
MVDVFESIESDLNATWKQNEILNDKLLEATLKHEVEKYVTSVRRPSSRSSSSKNIVLSNTKNHSEDVEVHVRINKMTNFTSKKNVVQTKKIVTNVDVKNTLKAKDVLCVSCDQNVLTPCHDKCLAKYKCYVNSKVKRALFTTPRTAKSKSLDATSIVAKTSGCSKHMTRNLKLLKNFIEKFMAQTALKMITLQQSQGQFSDGDLEVAFRSKTCYVQDLEGDDLLTGSYDSNLYTISISDMEAFYPIFLMSKTTSTKSWLWHRRLSHLNFGTINHLTKQYLVDGLMKFKYDKDHICSACEQGKRKKATLPPKLVPNTHFKLELIHMDLCGLIRVESINGKKYILVIVDDYSRYTWAHYEKLDKPLQQSTEFTSIPSKEDLDNLFHQIYEEYFEKSSLEVSINFAVQTALYNNETPSSSSIIVKDNEAVRNYVFLRADDENPPPPPVVTPTQQAHHTVSTIKLPILKKGEYDIWAIKMEHYLAHIDYPIWEVIQRGNGPVSVSTDTNGKIKVLPPKTVEEILAREKERKAMTTLLMAIPEDHLAKFHKMTDAKEMWDAIKSRFGGNDESKKMHKHILKQQFEGFFVSNSKGLHKGYDKFQSLLGQFKIYSTGVSTKDTNQKFLRSLPSSWSQVSLIMRTKPGVDSLSFDDLYNNLRVFETDVKGSTRSSSSAQNAAFVSSESTSSTNDVSTSYGATTSSRYNSHRENSSSYTDELMHSFFANQSSGP